MKKKILSICLVAVIAVLAITGASLAYFTANDTEENVFTVGNVSIDLKEDKWVAPANAVPGVAYAKDPIVYNTGANAAWIKVNVTLDNAAKFTELAKKYEIKTLTDIFTVNSDFDSKWELAGQPVADTVNDTLTYSYYYKSILAKGENTGELFTAVTIPAEFTSTDMSGISKFTITVSADAIQTADAYNTVAGAFAAFDGK